MSQMTTTLTADYFGSATIGVGYPGDSTKDFIIKGGPATMGIEFMLGQIQGGTAFTAQISPLGIVLIQLSTERALCAFFLYDITLKLVQGFHLTLLDYSA
jgi:hypothetical protein